MNEITVIGPSHHNTYSMVRCLGEAGFRIDAIIYNCKNSFIGKSKYLHHTYYFNEERDVLDYLIVNSEAEQKRVLLVCSDEIANLLDEHQNELIQYYCFQHSKSPGLLKSWMNKNEQRFLASKSGFLVPKSVPIAGESDVEHVDFYPCILKPLESIRGGKHICICQTKSELERSLQEFPYIPVLCQQFLQKDYEVVLLGLSIRGEVIIPGIVRKVRDVTGGTTYSYVLPVTSEYDEIVSSATRFMERIDYEGLFGIECICCRGEFFFIEANLRNDATTFALAYAGANLPVEYVKYMQNVDNEINREFSVQQLFSIVEFADFTHVLKGKVGIIQWLREYRGASCKYYWSKSDFPVFFAQLFRYLFFLIKIMFTHVFRKKH